MQTVHFSEKIIAWYEVNKRTLPWRESGDPYIIWLSEIILQQTRVEQGMPYFYKFIETFPDVKSFAEADEHDILKLWQGLGYYSRARNMYHAALSIVNEFESKFPASFTDLRKLKGVGDYTAAAIASFAYNLPHAVVDGNVYRFLSRHFGIHTPIDSTEGKRQFFLLANKLLDKKKPAIHNQAMMEVGALICTPRNPLCNQCPVNSSCLAFHKKTIGQLPVKSKKTAVKNRYLFYFLILYKNKFIIHKRTGNDIWKNLYDLPLVETSKIIKPEKIFATPGFISIVKESLFRINKISDSITHKLTHQNLHTVFIKLTLEQKNFESGAHMQFVSINNAKKFPFPKLIENYLLQEKVLKP
ncbi:MAG: A/G-specific adenine glycosylase [Bacteroidia bacterium]